MSGPIQRALVFDKGLYFVFILFLMLYERTSTESTFSGLKNYVKPKSEVIGLIYFN